MKESTFKTNRGMKTKRMGKWKTMLLLILATFLSLSSFAQGKDLTPFKLEENGKWGYKNSMGDIIVEPQYDWAGSFSEGIAAVGLIKNDWTGKERMQYGMINYKGDIVINPEYDHGYVYHGFFISDHVIIDRDGNTVRAKGNKKINGESYFHFLHLLGESDLVIVDCDKQVTKQRFLMHLDGTFVGQFDDYGFDIGFVDGLCRIRKIHGMKKHGEWKELFGYIDMTGKIVIKPSFREAKDFSEGLAVAADKRWNYGYIDKLGKWVIKPHYSNAFSFHNGLAFVSKPGFRGFVDKNDNPKILITEDSFDEYLWNKIDREADFGNPLDVFWLGNNEVKIIYRLEGEDRNVDWRIFPIKLRIVVINTSGDILYFINKDGKTDKDGNPIEE